MSAQPAIAKYRAVLGDKSDPNFAIVVVQDTGSVSWSIVSEQEFTDADCDDLPDDLFEQVNSTFESLNFSIDDETATNDMIKPDT